MKWRRHRWFLLLSLLGLILSAIVGMLLWQRVQTSSLAGVATEAGRFTNLMTLVRIGLIIFVAAFWRPIIRVIAGHQAAAPHAHLITWRWRMLGWWVVLELVLGQELLHRFIAMWM